MYYVLDYDADDIRELDGPLLKTANLTYAQDFAIAEKTTTGKDYRIVYVDHLWTTKRYSQRNTTHNT